MKLLVLLEKYLIIPFSKRNYCAKKRMSNIFGLFFFSSLESFIVIISILFKRSTIHFKPKESWLTEDKEKYGHKSSHAEEVIYGIIPSLINVNKSIILNKIKFDFSIH